MEREKIECCSENKVHPDLLKIVHDTMPEETELYDLAELYKVFGDSTPPAPSSWRTSLSQGRIISPSFAF